MYKTFMKRGKVGIKFSEDLLNSLKIPNFASSYHLGLGLNLRVF